jgi:hypothetical protein
MYENYMRMHPKAIDPVLAFRDQEKQAQPTAWDEKDNEDQESQQPLSMIKERQHDVYVD